MWFLFVCSGWLVKLEEILCEDEELFFSGSKTKKVSISLRRRVQKRGKRSGAGNSEDAREFGTYGTS